MRIAPNKLYHEGSHSHSSSLDCFHFCEARCPDCEYVCTLPLGEPKTITFFTLNFAQQSPSGHAQEHSTSHGSMIHTAWALEGDDDASREIGGHKIATGDSGAPMLCSMVCKELGRHTHIAECRSPDPVNCSHPEAQHISGEQHQSCRDWITHSLHWARSGKCPVIVILFCIFP